MCIHTYVYTVINMYTYICVFIYTYTDIHICKGRKEIESLYINSITSSTLYMYVHIGPENSKWRQYQNMQNFSI